MSDNITFMIELAVKPGEYDRFTALAYEMVEHIRSNEPGTVAYEFYLSGDGKGCHLQERYADSDAVMAHLASFEQHFAERFGPMVETVSFVVCGNPSDEVMDALRDASPAYVSLSAGFARFGRG